MRAERRQSPRRDCLKTGKLISRDDAVFWDCLVWNVSKGGALIELAPHTTPPSVTRLCLPALNLDHICQRVWQEDRKVGLAFVA